VLVTMVVGFVTGYSSVRTGSAASTERCVLGRAAAAAPGARRARVLQPQGAASVSMAVLPSPYEAIKNAGCFNTFMKVFKVLQKEGLEQPVESPWTMVLPTDKAFARLPPGTVQYLLENPITLRDILQYHVITDGAYKLEDLKGTGYLAPFYGEQLPYVALKGVVKFANAMAIPEKSNIVTSGGIIHALDSVMVPRHVKMPNLAARYIPPSITPKVSMSTTDRMRAVGATRPKAISGRKAMNLIKQQPFWMYGPPYNAATQEDYEPISAAAPKASVDYQLMPPGSVITVPDSYNAGELNPVSGMSKYIGQTKKLVGDQGLSKYADLLEEGL